MGVWDEGIYRDLSTFMEPGLMEELGRGLVS